MRGKKKLIYGFGIFLLLMLLFYLISRGIYAKNLPQVDVVSPEVMSLNHSVSVVGNVTCDSEEAVFVPQNLPISQLQVRLGDLVEVGEVLFICDANGLSELIEAEELAIEKLKLQLADISKNEQLGKDEKAKQESRAAEDYQDALETSQTDVERAKADASQADNQLKLHEQTTVSVTPEAERKRQQEVYQTYQTQVQDAESTYNAAKANVTAYQTQMQEKETEIASLEEEIKNLESGQVSGGDAAATTSLLEEAKAKLAEAQSALELLKEELLSAQTSEEEAKLSLSTLTANPVKQPDFSGEDNAKAQWATTKQTLENNVETAGRGVEDALTAQEEALKNASRQLEDAKEELPVDSTYETLSLELEVREKQLEEYLLLQENSGQVTSKQEGLITGVNIRAGSWTTSQAAFLLADTESAFLFEAHLSKEQKQYVNQNMQVSVFLGGVQPHKGKVDYLTESSLGDGSFDAAVRLESGMGSPGESGTLKASMQTETYGCCIPLEALHKDRNQKDYVLVLVETEGILGTELSVRKQFVQVLDKNDSYAALEPGALGEEKVITYATKEIDEGVVVRMRN